MNAMPISDWGHAAFEQAMFAAKYEPQALALALYELQTRISTFKEDTEEATDFVTAGGHHKWASRMRRTSSCGKKRDVTIRYSLPSGHKTEIHKLHNVDLYLFAWIDDDGRLDTYCVISVPHLIESKILDTAQIVSNKDGTKFLAVDALDLQLVPDCLLAGKNNVEQPVRFRWTTSREWAKLKP